MYCTAFLFLGCENISIQRLAMWPKRTAWKKLCVRAYFSFCVFTRLPPQQSKGCCCSYLPIYINFTFFTLQNIRCRKRDPCSIIHNLNRWFLTWVRLNPRGSVRKFQGFGEERPNCHFSTRFYFFPFLYIWNKIYSLHYPSTLLFWSFFSYLYFFYIFKVFV